MHKIQHVLILIKTLAMSRENYIHFGIIVGKFEREREIILD